MNIREDLAVYSQPEEDLDSVLESAGRQQYSERRASHRQASTSQLQAHRPATARGAGQQRSQARPAQRSAPSRAVKAAEAAPARRFALPAVSSRAASRKGTPAVQVEQV